MKRFFAFLMAATMMVGAVACSDDDEGGNDTPPRSNMFQVGEMPYALGAACCYVYEHEEGGLVRYELYFADKVYWDDEGNWPDDDAEYANGWELDLYNLYAETDSTNSILSGTYTYAGEDGHLTHDGASDYWIGDENGIGSWIEMGQQLVETSQLEIEINHISGSTYEIIFTGGVDEEGNAVSGYYKGEVMVFDYSNVG